MTETDVAPTGAEIGLQERKETSLQMGAETARIVLSTLDANALNPDNKVDIENAQNKLQKKKPKDLDFTNLSALSLENRKEVATSTSSARWNENIHRWITGFVMPADNPQGEDATGYG